MSLRFSSGLQSHRASKTAMENHPSNGRRKAIEKEPIKGRDIANQLIEEEVFVHKSDTIHDGNVEGSSMLTIC